MVWMGLFNDKIQLSKKFIFKDVKEFPFDNVAVFFNDENHRITFVNWGKNKRLKIFVHSENWYKCWKLYIQQVLNPEEYKAECPFIKSIN